MVNGIKHAINHQHMAGLWLLLIDIKGKWVADDLNGSENCHFDIAGKAMSSLAPQDFSFLGGSSRTPLGKQWWDNVGDFMGNFCRRFYGRQWDILLNDKSMAMLNSWRLPVFYTGFSMWRPWEKPASDRTRSENMPERPHNDELGTDPSGPQWSPVPGPHIHCRPPSDPKSVLGPWRNPQVTIGIHWYILVPWWTWKQWSNSW